MNSTYLLGSGRELLVFGGVKGLIRDGNDLENQLLSFRPDLILVSIPPEAVESLDTFMKDPFEISLSDYELIYGNILAEYGEVMAPPPIYIESLKYARRYGVEILGIDMTEQDYSQTYADNVGTMDLVRHSIRKNKLMRHPFQAQTPEEFVDEWSILINKVRGLGKVDAARLEEVKKRFSEVLSATERHRIAVVLDYEFYKEFLASLDSLGAHSNSHES